LSEFLRARLASIYDAYAKGLVEEVAAAFDDKVEFISYAPVDLFPYLGHREGKAEVLETLQAVRREFEILSYRPIFIVADGDDAAGLIDVRLRQLSTDRKINIMLGHFMRFRNGKIVEFREFTDSYDAAQQVLGQEIDISRH
jgi:ketosteroid isomerase-like protein